MERIRLREVLKRLKKIAGAHTELVSFYVPAGYNLMKALEQIRNELSTSQNIKSKTVRKNVTSALARIESHLKLYRSTPSKGVAIFSGNVDGKIELFVVEPPEPLKQKLYRCDKRFILDPLEEMLKETEVYGIVLIDKSEADIGIVRGKRIEHVKHMNSLVPGKTDKGGWSQARYARIREGLLRDFMKKVGEEASNEFGKIENIKGILIGGPGPVKNDFAEGDFLRYDIKKIVLGVVDTAYMGIYGLEECVERGKELMKDAKITREKSVMGRFFTHLAKDTGLAVYGIREVASALEKGNLEVLLISENFDAEKLELECSKCGAKETRIVFPEVEEQKCKKCGGRMNVIKKEKAIESFIETAENFGTRVEIISTETKEGKQLEEIGKIAGILRFRI